jgi:diguanylate cyclase (GGDEF)-like protein
MIAVIAVAGAPASAKPGPALPGGVVGLRLVDMPVATRDDPRAQSAVVDHLAPGTVIHRRIEVSNSAASAVRIVLYPAAATIVAGTFLGSAGTTPNDLSSWASVSPDRSEVPARGRVMATMTLTVPRDAAPGEQYGVIWAEARSAASGDGVVQVNRVGIRVYLSVGPGGPPAANFTINSLTATRSPDGRPMVVADVHNTGGRALDMTGSMRLGAGPGGLSAGPFPAVLGTTLAIGATEPVTITLDKRIPAGPWDAQIALRSGLLERRAAATITFPDLGTTASPVNATPIRVRPPYPIIAGLIVLFLLAIAVLLAVRRRRRRAAPGELQAHRPPPRTEAPSAERRHGWRIPISRLAHRPITVADIVEAPYHWQLALPDSHDALTELANRSLFEEEAQLAIDACGGERLCLMLINLDAFNHINNRFGRDGGDVLLITIAERLRRAIRRQDLLARLDSDNFAVLFEDVDRADVNAISRRMMKTVNEPLIINGCQVYIQASLGVAQVQSSDNAGLLMQHAAAALAEAKTATQPHHSWYAETATPGPSPR